MPAAGEFPPAGYTGVISPVDAPGCVCGRSASNRVTATGPGSATSSRSRRRRPRSPRVSSGRRRSRSGCIGRSRSCTGSARCRPQRDLAPPSRAIAVVVEGGAGRAQTVRSGRAAPVARPALLRRLHRRAQAPGQSARHGAAPHRWRLMYPGPRGDRRELSLRAVRRRRSGP